MTDALFGEPRLAAIYDAVEGERRVDLDHYLAIADEFGARSLLDVGCGTGILARQAASRGMEVTGVDPAGASLDVARSQPGAERVRWLRGDATGLPELQMDLATMTANVARAAAWCSRSGIRRAGPGSGGRGRTPTRASMCPAPGGSRPGGT